MELKNYDGNGSAQLARTMSPMEEITEFLLDRVRELGRKIVRLDETVRFSSPNNEISKTGLEPSSPPTVRECIEGTIAYVEECMKRLEVITSELNSELGERKILR